jgi:C1A family cysteine protease
MHRVLDRRESFDPKSRNYGVAEVIASIEPRKRYWTHGTVLDQGSEGACVGFGWTSELISSPKPFKVDEATGNNYALKLYNRAKQLDEWDGEDYSGTSVLAGAKATKETGYIQEYRWAFTTEQVRDALITEGPVVIGVNWYNSMYSTRPSGLVEVNGYVAGGHCITLTGYNPRARLKGEPGYHEVFRWKNSWGSSYGVNGVGYIKIEDLDKLLQERGEACVPMQRTKVRF